MTIPWPVIETGARTWKDRVLPLNYQGFYYLYSLKNEETNALAPINENGA